MLRKATLIVLLIVSACAVATSPPVSELLIRRQMKSIVCLGQSSDKIFQYLKSNGYEPQVVSGKNETVIVVIQKRKFLWVFDYPVNTYLYTDPTGKIVSIDVVASMPAFLP